MILPYDEGFVKGIEAVASGVGKGAQGERLLVAFRVSQRKTEDVGYGPRGLEGVDDVGNEVEGGAF